jgi:hypothetical protein
MNDYCPMCLTIKNLRMEINEKRTKDNNGKEQKIIIKNYFCSTCNAFGKSEKTKK